MFKCRSFYVLKQYLDIPLFGPQSLLFPLSIFQRLHFFDKLVTMSSLTNSSERKEPLSPPKPQEKTSRSLFTQTPSASAAQPIKVEEIFDLSQAFANNEAVAI